MAYYAYVTRIKGLHKHPNADRLQIGTCFGNSVIVSLDYIDEQLGVYFPTDGQVSQEFGEYNNLLRKKDTEGNNIGGYMDESKRNVRTVKLRGEPSDGLFLPLTCLEYTGVDLSTLKEGDRIDAVNGHEVCKKYIPKAQHRRGQPSNGNRTRKHKDPIAPLFAEHADTEQLAYNLGAFAPGDLIEISLKLHGTSQRTGHLPILKGYKGNTPYWDRIIQHLYGKEKLGKLAKKLLNTAMAHACPVYDWGYVTGTRRTICGDDFEGGFYGSNKFREQHAKVFEGKLWRGETVYMEIVGFTDTGTPIMNSVPNKRTNDKAFVKQYGETTTFSYGCDPDGTDGLPQSDLYVYRMTMTNQDGDVVEYTPDFMRYRCEQMGVKCVPVFWQGYIPPDEWEEECYDCNGDYGSLVCKRKDSPGEWIRKIAEQFYDGPDPVGKTHVREGVVVRIVNKPKFTAYKYKGVPFKMLEGIYKEEATAPDMEEAQEVSDES